MQNTKGPFMGIKGKGARETIPGPKYWRNGTSIATEMQQKPHFRGCTMAARTAPPAARSPLVLLLAVLLGIWIWAPGFDKTTIQGQWLFL